MKKLPLVLFSLLSLSLFSCASKDVAQPQSPLPEELPQDNFLQSEVIENNSQIEETSPVDESVAVKEDFELLPEIEEPEVITLPPEVEPVKVEIEPAEEPEIVPEKIDEETILQAQEPVKIEIVESDKTDVENVILVEANTEAESPVEEQAETQVESQVESQVETQVEVETITEETETSVENIEDDATDNDIIEKAFEKPVIPSRSVTLKKLEYLDITYPGNGWIYMGITDGSKDITYFGRKVGTANTKFSVQAKFAGTKILHFYKNDALTNTFIDDYLEVIILDEKGSNKTHIEAPEYKTPVTIVLEKPEQIIQQSEEAPAEVPEESKPTEIRPTEIRPTEIRPTEIRPTEIKPVETNTVESKPEEVKSPVVTKPAEVKSPVVTESSDVIEISDDDEVQIIEEIDEESLLKEIRELVKNKKNKNALEKIAIFLDNATAHTDEALFYKGQIYETKGELQNIQEAINAYTTLTKNYPASKYWDDANKRIIYLKRFYLEGR